MNMKYFIIIAFSIFSNNLLATDLPESDSIYICNNITTAFNEIVNAYCHSNVTSSIESDCELLGQVENDCSVTNRNESIMLISLSRSIEVKGVDKVNQPTIPAPTSEEINDIPKELLDRFPSLLITDAENPGNNELMTEQQSFGITIKCVNSIKNEWFCGFESLGFYRNELSKTNRVLSEKLKNEILETALSSVEKL